MLTITTAEILKSADTVHGMSENETRQFMKQMSKEQPFLQIYIAAILERGDFENENDLDAFADLSAIVFHVVRRLTGGRLVKIKGDQIDKGEAKMLELYDYAQDESEEDWPDLVKSWLEGYNQRFLLEFVLESLMSNDNPYGVTDEGSGLIFTYLKVLIDCLDNARLP